MNTATKPAKEEPPYTPREAAQVLGSSLWREIEPFELVGVWFAATGHGEVLERIGEDPDAMDEFLELLQGPYSEWAAQQWPAVEVEGGPF